jgi:hypothetical protein
VKTVFNEWSLTRSSPSWTFFNGDIAVAYRWTDNDDHTNDLTVSFNGSGIESNPMGDRNDTQAILNGLRASLVKVRTERSLTFTVTH